ncbi:MAG: DUF418 domain-containing protein [Aquisalimonadaceae bacterium]
MTSSNTQSPGQSTGRTNSRVPVLDVLRGVAILGILLMNIQSFGRLSSEYMNPKALGDPALLDWAVWVFSHVVADEKFISMLTLLFGAGIVLMAKHSRDAADVFEQRFRKRMAWLLVFGLVHGLLLWPGDILAAYAICGLVAVRFRDQEPVRLAMTGIFLLTMAMLLWLLLTAALVFVVPESTLQQLITRHWEPSRGVVAEEVTGLTFNWLTTAWDRAVHALGAQLWMLASDRIWRMLGMMFLGMALLKTGFLAGQWSLRQYYRVTVAGLAVGVPLVLGGIWFNEAMDWDFRYSMFLGRIPNHWGSVAIALAWVSVVIILVRQAALQRASRALEAVGRLAMTNYIAQTIICTTIFYGFGLGLFLQLGYLELLGVVAAVWTAQIAFSLTWRRFKSAGPLETLWRRLSA